MRSVPPFTMKSWLNHEFATNYIMDDANQIVETASRLTDDINKEKLPPDPEDERLPEPHCRDGHQKRGALGLETGGRL